VPVIFHVRGSTATLHDRPRFPGPCVHSERGRAPGGVLSPSFGFVVQRHFRHMNRAPTDLMPQMRLPSCQKLTRSPVQNQLPLSTGVITPGHTTEVFQPLPRDPFSSTHRLVPCRGWTGVLVLPLLLFIFPNYGFEYSVFSCAGPQAMTFGRSGIHSHGSACRCREFTYLNGTALDLNWSVWSVGFLTSMRRSMKPHSISARRWRPAFKPHSEDGRRVFVSHPVFLE